MIMLTAAMCDSDPRKDLTLLKQFKEKAGLTCSQSPRDRPARASSTVFLHNRSFLNATHVVSSFFPFVQISMEVDNWFQLP